jgi:hypothetical protein
MVVPAGIVTKVSAGLYSRSVPESPFCAIVVGGAAAGGIVFGSAEAWEGGATGCCEGVAPDETLAEVAGP